MRNLSGLTKGNYKDFYGGKLFSSQQAWCTLNPLQPLKGGESRTQVPARHDPTVFAFPAQEALFKDLFISGLM